MKLRNGFVSNSSSSSFILSNTSSVGQIALAMMYQVRSEYDRDQWHEDNGLPPGFMEAIEWLHENLDYNEPIMLPWTCNYETFIWPSKDKIYVDTCNNHDWYLLGGDWVEDGSLYDEIHGVSFLNLSDMEHTTKKAYTDERWRQLSENS